MLPSIELGSVHPQPAGHLQCPPPPRHVNQLANIAIRVQYFQYTLQIQYYHTSIHKLQQGLNINDCHGNCIKVNGRSIFTSLIQTCYSSFPLKALYSIWVRVLYADGPPLIVTAAYHVSPLSWDTERVMFCRPSGSTLLRLLGCENASMVNESLKSGSE